MFTGYNQGPLTTQQTPIFSCQESTSDDLLYHQIMQDAMCYAPTLTRDLELPMLDETFELSEHYHASPPPAGIHRRSYILATRQDSSKGKIYVFFFLAISTFIVIDINRIFVENILMYLHQHLKLNIDTHLIHIKNVKMVMFFNLKQYFKFII